MAPKALVAYPSGRVLSPPRRARRAGCASQGQDDPEAVPQLRLRQRGASAFTGVQPPGGGIWSVNLPSTAVDSVPGAASRPLTFSTRVENPPPAEPWTGPDRGRRH